MKPISNARIIIIALVAIISIYLTLPTARYYMHLHEQPSINGQRPIAESNRPADTQTQELASWKVRNPEVVRWEEANKDYIAWEKQSEELVQQAIPLGLDLRGGVDVTLQLDRNSAIKQKLDLLREGLRRSLETDKLAVQFIEGGDADRLSLKVVNPADAQTAANLINRNYEGMIDATVTADALAAGPVSIGMKAEAVDRDLNQDLQGARKAIEDRVNSLGVTQPKISLQGTNRIRVQVPGEKDPDRVIRNVIKPANLEFHLVIEDEYKYLGQDGKVTRGTVLPPGTAAYAGKTTRDKNKTTGEITYDYRDHILYKKAELVGADLRSATVTFDQSDPRDPIKVSLEFKPDGSKRFADLTTKYSAQTPPRQMAILLDGVVRSDPRLNVPITDGRAVIEGGFSDQEATELSQILKAGSLPAPLTIISKRTVGATLGNQSIIQGVEALVWGTIIIAGFMMLYYGTAGIIAVAALILNVLIIFALMAISKATLTLSGIGGILLTVGMAVDANVLIYEHMREEIANGRTLKQAIATGYRRAFAVILDSHLTALITSLVLLQFTEGSVFGFALTTTFGLLASLFTGLTVTYTLCVLWFGWKESLSLGKLHIIGKTNVDFIGMRWFSIGLSNVVLVAALILVVARGGMHYGVEFAGGLSADISFTQPVAETDLRKALGELDLSGGTVTRVVDKANTFIVDLPLKETKGHEADPNQTEQVLRADLEKAFPGAYKVEKVDVFGPQIGQEFSNLALTVVLIASIAIMIYLGFRFEPVFGVGAVVALLHDLMIVTLICALWGVEVSLDQIAALMVLMGLSVNDTIVIFDRIRENAGTVYGKTFKEQCNLAMNQSISRTVITSGTVLFASLVLLFLGGAGLATFAKIMTVGIICGTYSSDFIATPLVYMWNEYKGNRVQQQLAAKKKKVETNQPVRGPRRERRVGTEAEARD